MTTAPDNSAGQETPMQHSEQINELAAAVNALMQDVGYVQKQTDAGQYMAAGEREVIAAVRPAMVAHGLALLPVSGSVSQLADKSTKRGDTLYSVCVEVYYILLHTSGQWMHVWSAGEGSDNGDKATAGAMTMAYKYALRESFTIETGNDPDQRRPEEGDGAPPREPAPPNIVAPTVKDPELLEVAELRAGCGFAIEYKGWSRDDVGAALIALGADSKDPRAEQIEDPGVRAHLFRYLTKYGPTEGLKKVRG